MIEKCNGKARLRQLQSIRIIEKEGEPVGDPLESMCDNSRATPSDYLLEVRYSQLEKNTRCPNRGIVIIPEKGESLESCYTSETGLNIYDEET